MAARQNPLSEYNRRRDFSKTGEPQGKAAPARNGQKRFLVQKHDATRLHYDFRLEWGGVLKSWAVTRGPSLNPDDKRLAVRTEDHPIAYGDFEGTIPEKQYGGGTVMLWDTGWWEPDNDPEEGLQEGKLKFHLHGERMQGGWTLVRMRPRPGEKRENWLLIKETDAIASDDGDNLIEDNTTSVFTGRTMTEIAAGKGEAKKHVWQSEKSAAANVKAGAIDEEAPRLKPRKRSGKPPGFQKPQLATLVSQAPDGDDWLNEVKFDGYRLLVAVGGGEARCYTRTGLDWTEKFHTIVDTLAELDCNSALVDGEAVAATSEGSSFSALQKALKHGGDTRFYAFDLLELNGRDLRKKPLIERKRALKALLDALGPTGTVQYSEHVRGNGAKVFAAMCKSGQEGIIAKEADAPYQNRRTRSWLKIKCTKRQEFVIGGYSPSSKKGRAFASLLVGTFENGKLVYQGRIGTGFDEARMEELSDAFAKRRRKTPAFTAVPDDIGRDAIWLTPDLVAEVDFAEFTDDGHIRHGAFEGLRRDKEAKTVTLERPKLAKVSKARAEHTPDSAKRASGKAQRAQGTTSRAANSDAGDTVLGVRITHPERELFEGEPITKLDLARYYAVVAEKMLPFAGDHLLSLMRCPQGSRGQCFYQKHASDGFPEEIHETPVKESSGDTENYMYVRDANGLVAAVQMGTLEFHIWGSPADKLETPDRLVFDLDPDPSVGFSVVKNAAISLRDALDEIGLKSVPMVTGGKGVHVIVPLTPRAPWEDAKRFAKAFAQGFADRDPDNFIATMSKAKRKGRIFIDWLRNERGATAIAPYSTRARPGGPVATPVSWSELSDLDAANGFHISDILGRIESGIDPWSDLGDTRQSLTKKILDALPD
ncbi:DNA ligase D [Ensifer sp. HO-A22]|uniref:DNA ligase (ATP) n=1 Tax=Ensifer oleiphilus TaxID=2742698 RepID=A0A7Y6Q9D3_9HYPH|nr:DNA ligase D [Ensifer oleiphilus]NVD41497.1 DNA ligase D [Ensifer oleiphilus]